MKILIGTKNAYKVGEMEYLISDIKGVEVMFLKDVDLDIHVEEDQPSLLGNAQKKAREISIHFEDYVLCSDGGMDIPGLGKKWDVLRNQRIVGEHKTDLEKANTLLNLMNGLKGSERKAEYRFALAIGLKGEVLWSEEEVTEKGFIAEKLLDENIPEFKWMGQVLYFPEYERIHNNLSFEQRVDLREKSMSNLKEKVSFFINSLNK